MTVQDHGVTGSTEGSPSSAKASHMIEHYSVDVSTAPDM